MRLDYTSQPAGAARPFSALQRRRARLPAGGERSPTSCASASLPRIPRARWWRPRSMPAAPTTAPLWCSTWLAWKRPQRPTSAPASRELPLIAVPQGGETIDGFVLKVLLSDGRYTRLFGAEDEVEGGEVALKFPKPLVATRGHLSRGLRPRGVGRRARHQPLARPHHRTAAGAAELPLHGDAALPGRASGDPAHAPARVRTGGGTSTSRSSWRGRRRRCTAPASSIATSSRTT